MKELSKIALAVEPSTTMAIDAMFKQMKAEGQNVIGFGAGEPDFPTPEHIKQAGIQAIEHNETRYTPAAGTIDLRKAICQRLKEDCGISYEHTQVAVSNGAKPCVYVALRALVNPGDEVILPAPYWVSYIELIRMVGGVPVVVEATEAEQLDQAASSINRELEALAQVCVEKDIYVISDEIYYSLVYDNKEFVSLAAISPEIKERTLLVNGVSKSYAMTGWRIGYVAAPAHIAKIIANYLSHSTGSPCTISQKASEVALSASQETVEEMRKAFEERRNYMVERMNQIPGVSCIKPEGAFYAMVDVSAFGVDGDTFAAKLLKEKHVAVIPGSGLGENCKDAVRISFAASEDTIRKATARMKEFIQEKAYES